MKVKSISPAVGLVLAVASLGYADMVTVNLTGYVTGRDDPSLFPTILDGAVVTGCYTYDKDAAPSLSPYPYAPPGSMEADYPVTAFTLTFADTAFAAGSTIAASGGTLTLLNFPDWNMSLYGVAANSGDNVANLTGSFAGAAQWDEAMGRFNSGSALASFPTIPDPSGVLSQFLFDTSSVGVSTQVFYFETTSLSAAPQAVPVPGAVVLALVGLGTAGGLLRRQRVARTWPRGGTVKSDEV